jgi:hypothetical protein
LIIACSKDNVINFESFEIMTNYYSSFLAADRNNDKVIDKVDTNEIEYLVWLENEEEKPTKDEITKYKQFFIDGEAITLVNYID